MNIVREKSRREITQIIWVNVRKHKTEYEAKMPKTFWIFWLVKLISVVAWEAGCGSLIDIEVSVDYSAEAKHEFRSFDKAC